MTILSFAVWLRDAKKLPKLISGVQFLSQQVRFTASEATALSSDSLTQGLRSLATRRHFFEHNTQCTFMCISHRSFFGIHLCYFDLTGNKGNSVSVSGSRDVVKRRCIPWFILNLI